MRKIAEKPADLTIEKINAIVFKEKTPNVTRIFTSVVPPRGNIFPVKRFHNVGKKISKLLVR